jgi:hypothetical protein
MEAGVSSKALTYVGASDALNASHEDRSLCNADMGTCRPRPSGELEPLPAYFQELAQQVYLEHSARYPDGPATRLRAWVDRFLIAQAAGASWDSGRTESLVLAVAYPPVA